MSEVSDYWRPRVEELEARDAMRESQWAEQIKRYQGELAAARARIAELGAECDRLRDLVECKDCMEYTQRVAAAIESATIERIKSRIDYRLNDCLCEMKEGYDDSITGFNEAWDIMRAFFKEEEANHALKETP
jgi:hypothetical protein